MPESTSSASPTFPMAVGATPTISAMRVIPVAGRDGMLLNLSGAHAPFFTRNLVLLTDSSGNTGVGEVPGLADAVLPGRGINYQQYLMSGLVLCGDFFNFLQFIHIFIQFFLRQHTP